MKAKLLAIFLAAGLSGLAATPAYSRIGWTFEQCLAQYGTPEGPTAPDHSSKTVWKFKKDGWELYITLRNSTAVRIEYHAPEDSTHMMVEVGSIAAPKAVISDQEAIHIRAINYYSYWERYGSYYKSNPPYYGGQWVITDKYEDVLQYSDYPHTEQQRKKIQALKGAADTKENVLAILKGNPVLLIATCTAYVITIENTG